MTEPDTTTVRVDRITVQHKAGGWTLPFLSPDQQTCTTNHQPDYAGPPCTDTAVWKVAQVHEDARATIGFWCDKHLPVEHRPAAALLDHSEDHLAAALAALREEPAPEPAAISRRVAAHVLWQEGLGGHPAGSFTTALLKAWWLADPANSARLAAAWPEYGAAITLLTQPGGVDQLRAIAGEQPAPDRP